MFDLRIAVSIAELVCEVKEPEKQTMVAFNKAKYIRDPVERSRSMFDVGKVLFSEGLYNESDEAFKMSLEDDPDNSNAAAWIVLLSLILNHAPSDKFLRKALDPDTVSREGVIASLAMMCVEKCSSSSIYEKLSKTKYRDSEGFRLFLDGFSACISGDSEGLVDAVDKLLEWSIDRPEWHPLAARMDFYTYMTMSVWDSQEKADKRCLEHIAKYNGPVKHMMGYVSVLNSLDTDKNGLFLDFAKNTHSHCMSLNDLCLAYATRTYDGPGTMDAIDDIANIIYGNAVRCPLFHDDLVYLTAAYVELLKRTDRKDMVKPWLSKLRVTKTTSDVPDLYKKVDVRSIGITTGLTKEILTSHGKTLRELIENEGLDFNIDTCQVVEYAHRNWDAVRDFIVECADDPGSAAVCISLLAEKGDGAGKRILLDSMGWDEEGILEAYGDLIDESVPSMLYSLCGKEDVPELMSIAEDPDIYQYCRMAAILVLYAMAHDGTIDSKDVLDLAYRISPSDDRTMNSIMAYNLLGLPFNNVDIIRAIVDSHNYDRMAISLNEVPERYDKNRWKEFSTLPEKITDAAVACTLPLTPTLGSLLRYEKEMKIGSFLDDLRKKGMHEEKNVGNDNAPANRKIGPNEKCPCGSGKKYKKCCGKRV